MCGIAGIITTNNQPADPSTLAAMNRALFHRGPDDAGTASRWARNLGEAAEVYNWEHEGEKLVGWFEERVGGPT